jgi:hypothetical protein
MRAHLWLLLGIGFTGCFKGPVDLSDYGDIDSTSGSSGGSSASLGSTGGTGSTGGSGSSGSHGSGTSGTTGTIQPPCQSLVGGSLTLESLAPAALAVQGGSPTQALWSVKLVYASGLPAAGCAIAFAEAEGESLVAVGPTTAYIDSSGVAGTVVASRATAGTAHLTASIGVFSLPVTLPIQ